MKSRDKYCSLVLNYLARYQIIPYFHDLLYEQHHTLNSDTFIPYLYMIKIYIIIY